MNRFLMCIWMLKESVIYNENYLIFMGEIDMLILKLDIILSRMLSL